MTAAPDSIPRLRRPEYTGENRCMPCTAVNVAIAACLALGVAVAVSVPAGALAFGASLAVVYLRGYLVPGTPTLTRRYLPDRVLEWFGKADSPARPTVETADLGDALERLSAADVVRRRDERDGRLEPDAELRLTRDFRERWRDRLPVERGTDVDGEGETVLPDADAVATLVGSDAVDRRGDVAFEIDGSRLLRWESDAALAADVAADRELRARLEGWAALPFDDRREVLSALRLLLGRCPGCDGRLERRRERLEHCCRRPRVALESECAACGRQIAAVTVTESDPLLERIPAD